MQKLLRKWLVGIGLVVALLALAVPAFAQNTWTKQTSPSPFDTPVQALAYSSANTTLDAGTSGGAYPAGGVLGFQYFDNTAPYGDVFTASALPGAPSATDVRAILWDSNGGTNYRWVGTADQDGLYLFTSGGPGWTNPSAGVPTVNQAVNCLAVDTSVAMGPGLPHMLYFGTLGSGIYKYDGTTFTNLTQGTWPIPPAPATYPEGYINKMVLVNTGGGSRYIYATTEGGFILRGHSTNSGSTWSWDKIGVSTLPSGFNYGIAYGNGALWVGTAANGIYRCSNETAGTPTFSSMTATTPITTRVTDIVYGGTIDTYFASTLGQGVYRYQYYPQQWMPINLNSGNTCVAGGYLQDMKVLSLAYDSGLHTLWAGTEDAAGKGNVWSIDLVAMVSPGAQNFARTVNDGAGPNTVGMTPAAACSPYPWTANRYTGSSLPAGLSLTGTYNSPTTNIAITGDPTQMYCNRTSYIEVFDALGNRTTFDVTYDVAPAITLTHTPANPGDVGTPTTFTYTFDMGPSDSVDWTLDFGDGSTMLTGTQVGPGTLTTVHTYASSGTYPAVLYATPSAPSPCNTPPPSCTEPNACAGDSVEIYGQMNVLPWAQVQAGAQYRYGAVIIGGCAPYHVVFDFGDGSPTVSQDWPSSPAITDPTLPDHTYAATGTYNVTLTVTDCKGYEVQGTLALQYSGTDSGSLSSWVNPAGIFGAGSTNVQYRANFNIPAGATNIQARWDFDGDGTFDDFQSPPTLPDSFWDTASYDATFLNDPGGCHGHVLVSVQIRYFISGHFHNILLHYTQYFYKGMNSGTMSASPNPQAPCKLQLSEVPNGITLMATPDNLACNLGPWMAGLPAGATFNQYGYRYTFDVTMPDGTVVTLTDPTPPVSGPAGLTQAQGTALLTNALLTGVHGGAGMYTVDTHIWEWGPIPTDFVIPTYTFYLYNDVDAVNNGFTMTSAITTTPSTCVHFVTGGAPVAFSMALNGSLIPPGALGDYQFRVDWQGNGTYDTGWTAYGANPDTSQTHDYTADFLALAGSPASYVFHPRLQVRNFVTCNVATTVEGDVVVYNPLVATGPTPTWAQDCGTYTVHFDATGDVSGGYNGDPGTYKYTWTWGDGTVPEVTNGPIASHTYTQTAAQAVNGLFNVILTVTDNAGHATAFGAPCNAPADNTVNVGAPHFQVQVVSPIITGTVDLSSYAGCLSGGVYAVTATANGFSGGGLPIVSTDLTYHWDFGDGFTTTTTSPTNYVSHNYTAAGAYVVKVYATANGLPGPATYRCPTAPGTIDSSTLNIYTPASSVMLNPTSTSDLLPLADNFTTTWAGTAPVNSIDYTFLRIKDYMNNPVADAPIVMTLSGSGPYTSPVQYAYTFMKTGTWEVTATLHTLCGNVSTAGVVTVQVLRPNDLGVTTTSLVNGVAGNAGTTPLTVAFGAVPTGGVPPYTYLWNFDDPTSGDPTSTSQNPTHVFNTAGVHHVTITVTDNWPAADGGPMSKTEPITITVYDPITATLTAAPTAVQTGVDVTFHATASGGNTAGSYTYAINYGDGAVDQFVGAVASHDFHHTYTTPKPSGYSANVTVTDSSSNSGISNPVNVNVYGPISVTLSATPNQGTAPLSSTLTAVATGGNGDYSFEWDFGDGSPMQTTTQGTVNHTYASAFTGSATVTVTDTETPVPQSAFATTPIVVWNPLTISTAATTATSGDVGVTVGFSATVAGGDGSYSVVWHFGDGATGSGMTPSHQYLTAGSYACYAVVTDGSSHSATSASIPVTVYSPLTVSLAGTPTSGTLPLPVTFTALAQGGDGHYTYSYNYGDGNTGSDSNHTYTTAGTYNAKVTVTDTASHTVTSTNVAITVWAPLTASIASGATTGTTPFLVNFTSTVAGGDSHYSYNWNFGDGTTATTANPAKTYNAAGNYSVTLTVSDTSSHTVVSNTINMTVYAPLTVSASATPTNLTVGDSSTFTAVASGGDGHYSYAWTFGDGSTGTGATANHVYTTYHAGDFTWMAHVTVTDTASHSVTSADIAIVVKPVPPSITYAKKQHSPFRIVLFGTNFQDGCTATINGVPVQVKYKNGGKIKLKDAKSLCPKGVAVTIVVTNPDGGVSAPFQFTR